MPEQQEQQASPKTSFEFFFFAVSCYAWTILPISRCDMGKRAFGIPSFVAILGLFWYAAKCRTETMLAYCWCWVAFAIYRRVTANPETMTEYQGWPYLTGWLVTDELTARLLEAVLVWITGNCLSPYCEAMGHFLIGAGIALGLKLMVEWYYEQRINDNIHDADAVMRYRLGKRR